MLCHPQNASLGWMRFGLFIGRPAVPHVGRRTGRAPKGGDLCGSAAPRCGKAQPYRKLLNFSSAAPPPSSPESLNRKLLNFSCPARPVLSPMPGEAAEPQEPD